MDITNLKDIAKFIKDDDAKNEDKTISSSFRNEELLEKKIDNEIKREDKEQRKLFGERMYSFVVYYMFFVGVVVLLAGSQWMGFYLSDAVLVTLLGTTTATVIGVFNFVMKYLFFKK